MQQAIWKYSWNPAGYPIETFRISTDGKQVGDFIYLPHSFFKKEGFAAELITPKKSLAISTSPGPKVDLLLVDLQTELSKSAGYEIYRKVQLQSPRVCNTTFSCSCSFVADALDPADFGQELHQTADVQHKSVTVEKLLADEAALQKARIEELTGSWGSISEKEIVFPTAVVRFGPVTVTDEAFSTKKPFYLRSMDSYLGYNPTLKKWVTINERSEKEVPIITLYTDVKDVPKYSIPVVLASDPTSIQFVPWLSLVPEQRALAVEQVHTGSTKLSSGSITDPKKLELQAGDAKITLLADGTVQLGDVRINAKTNTIKFGDITIDRNLIRSLVTLDNKLKLMTDTIAALQKTVQETQGRKG